MHIPVTQRPLNNWPLRLTACFKSSSEDSSTNTGYRVQTVALIMWMADTLQPAKKKIRTCRDSNQQLKTANERTYKRLKGTQTQTDLK